MSPPHSLVPDLDGRVTPWSSARSLLNRRLGRLLTVTLIVAASSTLQLRNLGDPYIHIYDEAVHLNVARNLVIDCCTPKLHRQPLGADASSWLDNYVWLHKPPMPFYVQAGVARLFDTGVWTLRFVALLFAQLIVVLVFYIGVKFFDTLTGVTAASLVAFNYFTFQLVQGWQFSGIPDLTLACALMGVLAALLSIVQVPRRRYYLAFGALSGLAFLCKDGLSLIPFFVLLLARPPSGWREHATGLVIAVAAALIVLSPATVYLAYRFPVEAMHEQQQRVGHLLRDIEGWSRPFDFYWTVYFQRVTSPLVTGSAYVAAALGLTALRRNARLQALSLWVAAYPLILSFGVSKITNFIYPVLPAVALLLPATGVVLWRQGRHRVIVAAAATVIASAVVFQLDLFDSSNWLADSPRSGRATLLVFQGAIFAISLALLTQLPLPRPSWTSAASAAVAMALVLAASIRADVAAATRRRPDHDRQMALREASLAIRPLLARDDIVLVDWPGINKSHLLVMYWSGLDSFEVTADKPVAWRMSLLPPHARVFLLHDAPATEPAAATGTSQRYALDRLR
jgi:4-amino-4-deoxy-L-arabinose transferase-like glycosyltransferase